MPRRAQPQQPVLDRRPAVGIVLAQRRRQARQVVEHEQLDAVEERVELGLDLGAGEGADAALDQVDRENPERPRRRRCAAV